MSDKSELTYEHIKGLGKQLIRPLQDSPNFYNLKFDGLQGSNRWNELASFIIPKENYPLLEKVWITAMLEFSRANNIQDGFDIAEYYRIPEYYRRILGLSSATIPPVEQAQFDKIKQALLDFESNGPYYMCSHKTLQIAEIKTKKQAIIQAAFLGIDFNLKDTYADLINSITEYYAKQDLESTKNNNPEQSKANGETPNNTNHSPSKGSRLTLISDDILTQNNT